MSNIVDKVCVFIGPGPALIRKVLQFSIQRRVEVTVDFRKAAVPWWAVPWANEWHGVALHLSPWQIAALDVTSLVAAATTVRKNGPAVVTTSAEFPGPVMAIDCAAAKRQWQWHLPLRQEYLKRAGDATVATRDGLERGDWLRPRPGRIANDPMLSLAGDAGDLSAWLDPAHPCAGALRYEIVQLLGGDRISQDELTTAVEAGHVHPDYAELADQARLNSKFTRSKAQKARRLAEREEAYT